MLAHPVRASFWDAPTFPEGLWKGLAEDLQVIIPELFSTIKGKQVPHQTFFN